MHENLRSSFSTSLSLDEIAGLLDALPLSMGDIILLSGDLGSGKTTLAGEIVARLEGTSSKEREEIKGAVTSPTFSLVNEYDRVNHYDLYNKELEHLLELGLVELLSDTNRLHLVEWGGALMPLLSNLGLKYFLLEIGFEDAEARGRRSYTLYTGGHDA